MSETTYRYSLNCNYCVYRLFAAPRCITKGTIGGTLMNDKILNECRQAKEQIAALFGDVDTLIDFLMKRREQRLKQGKKSVDFSPYREKQSNPKS